MKKIILFVFAAAVVHFIYFFVLNLKTMTDAVLNLPSKAETEIAREDFNIYISRTPEERERGLSGFSDLKDDEAMLFIFESSDLHGFWMKEMNFAIDMVWLDENFKVISVERGVTQGTYPKVFYPESPSLYVLEFKSGVSGRLNMEKGDQVLIYGFE